MDLALPSRLVAPYADRLVGFDFPDLPADRRRATVGFVVHRVDTLPSFAHLGVIALGALFRVLIALPGGFALSRAVVGLPLPFVPEYPRLIRSLAVAFIWERWPHTTPTGLAA
jgi:hypothetical protein